jgi:hypothetical protein
LGLLILAACGNSSPTSSTGIAQVQLSVSPSTPAAQSSTNSQFQYEVDFTLDLTETGGVAATIEQVSGTVDEVVGGIAVDTGTVLDEIQVNSNSNRLDAGGSLNLPFQVFYTLPGGGTTAQIILTLDILDDNGYQVGGTVALDVP